MNNKLISYLFFSINHWQVKFIKLKGRSHSESIVASIIFLKEHKFDFKNNFHFITADKQEINRT